MDLQLKGKTAIVTGGSIGIGLAIAEGLATEGCNLILVARNRDRLQETGRAVADKYGVEVTAVVADVARPEGCDAVVAAAAAGGGVDILINNAGTGSGETVMEAPDEKWDQYWDLHVKAAVRLARGVQPGMKARGGGVILHNASICAIQPLWYEPIYCVSKSALLMFSKTLSYEFIKDNIRVNTVNAGLILTPDWIKTAKQLTADTGGDYEAYLQKVADEFAPIKRFGTPEEAANLFVFLASPRASYCVGSTYYVDGGMLRTI